MGEGERWVTAVVEDLAQVLDVLDSLAQGIGLAQFLIRRYFCHHVAELVETVVYLKI